MAGPVTETPLAPASDVRFYPQEEFWTCSTRSSGLSVWSCFWSWQLPARRLPPAMDLWRP